MARTAIGFGLRALALVAVVAAILVVAFSRKPSAPPSVVGRWRELTPPDFR